MKKQLFMPLLMIALLFAPVLSGCAGQGTDTGFDIKPAKAEAAADILTSASQLSESGRRIGVMTGTTGELFAAETYPEAKIDSFSEYMDAVSALKADKLDAVITSDVAALRVSRENSDLGLLPEKLLDEPIAAAFRKEDAALLRDVNEVIAALQGDGTLQDMETRLLDSDPAIPADVPEGIGEVLRIGCTATRAPFNYMDGEGRIVGYAPELARRIGYALDRRVEFVTMEFSALIAALQSGKIDIIVDMMSATEERKMSVSFSEPYYISGQMILVKRDSALPPQTYRAEDWAGKTFSIWTGTVYDNIIREKFADSKPLYFNSAQEVIEAVRTGKADATLLDEPTVRNYIAKYPELTILYPLVTLDEYGIVFGKEYPELREGFNKFLKEIKADGTYDDIAARWLDSVDPPPMPEITLTGKNGTLRFATIGIDEPFSFIQNGKIAGFDVEMAYRYAEYMGMDLQIELMDFGGMIPAVQSGKVHFAGDLISITEERKQFVDFTDPYYTGGVAMVTKAEADMASVVRDDTGNASGAASFWQGVQKSFYQNLIVENRWQMLVKGLGVTMLISVFAFALATLMGFAVCYMRMSGNSLLRGIASVYITILRGTPIVVLLMITYYIIFASVDINSTIVAIIAFGFNGGAFIGEIIRSAILTVDKGQVEAARSMGFSKTGAFLTVTFPQAVRVALPVYKSEFISMVKATAIVGYIAIVDLTKAGDIIRSRTYDAFFPLIIIALVYLAATGILVWIFGQIDRLTDKRQRRAKR